MKSPGFEEIEHPSDIGLGFRGRKIEELFENAGVGMFSLITDISRVEPSHKIRLKLSAAGGDPENMLILWLEKLLYHFEVDDMVFSRIEVEDISIDKKKICLCAALYGEKIDSRKHSIINAIKAPTYHLLNIAKDKQSGTWAGSVIFDV